MGKPEGTIEKYLKKEANKLGFLCFKFTSGDNGVPDRIIIGNGQVVFTEVKAPGEKPRPDQVVMIKKINQRGVPAVYVDTRDEVDVLLQNIQKGEFLCKIQQ